MHPARDFTEDTIVQQRPPVQRQAQPRPTGNPAQRPTQVRGGAQSQRPVTQRSAQARPAQRPAAPAGGNNELIRNILVGIGVVAVLVLAFILQFKVFPDGRVLYEEGNAAGSEENKLAAEISGSSVFQFSEIMSSNGSALMDDANEYPDWVELTNTGSSAMDLEGFVIAKQTDTTRQFVFPEMALQPGEHVVVFCDNTLANVAGSAFHAPFKISAAGDTIMLFNPSGTAVEAVNVPAMEKNTSYYKDAAGEWVAGKEYTPNMANTAENHKTLVANAVTVASDVIVTEFMASNVSYVPDETGAYGDWIEITNTGSQPVNLKGYGLSDTRDKVVKWKFPDVTLGAGQSMIVYCDGKNLTPTDGSPLHTNFSLSSEKESILFSNANSQLITCIDYDILKPDQSMSLQSDGSWATDKAPTPGHSNTNASAALIENQFAAQNTLGVYISEVMASTSLKNYQDMSYDWVELYNSTGNTVNLSGMGISDDPSQPRKWQFPEGTTIAPGEYQVLYLSGLNTTKYEAGKLSHASFSLAADGGEALVLSTAAGEIVDRVPLPTQYSNISYGRITGQQGFFYFSEHSAMAANPSSGYRDRAEVCDYSVAGGTFNAGETLTVELSCQPGAQIYYTLDCTDPTQLSTPYTGPITISDTTILRTIVYADDSLPSFMDSQSYFFGLDHTMEVVSIVTDPDNLFSPEYGIYVKDETTGANSKHTGWRDTEMEAHVEVFETDGNTLLSQGCGIMLHGQYSRAEAQKAFKVIARSQYGGGNRFKAKLFSDREFTEYQSFILRASGQDGDKTRMRDSVLTDLARNTSVMYQETELCVVYLNGQYWGHYNMRERINAHMIAQHEGWVGDEDNIDLVKANSNTMQGSNETFEDLLAWIAENGIDTDEEMAYVDSIVDVRNYMEYVAIQSFTGNTDLLNVKRYRNANGDGRWRWILFDMDWAFNEDTNSARRWLNPDGAGSGNKTNNKLFIALMKNEKFFDEYCTFMGEMLATDWSTESVLALIKQRYDELLPEMPAHLARWNVSESQFNSSMKKFISYAETRPAKLLGYMQEAYGLTDAQMQHYFGDAIAKVEEYAAKSGEGGD